MDDGAFPPNSGFGNFSDSAMDLDFMDELLFEGCWLETTEELDVLQPGCSSSGALNDPPSQHVLFSGTNTGHCSDPHQEQERLNFPGNPPHVYPQIEEPFEIQSENQKVSDTTTFSSQSESFLVEGTEMGKRLWIAPRANQGPSSSVKERLMQALGYLTDCTSDRDVLIQMWVPVKKEGRNVLTTNDQPYTLDPNSKSLAHYRNVSRHYHFAAEEDSKDLLGLPGRVFLGKLPEWTPDVRFFKSEEYPRIGYAQQYNVSGSLAIPVFERGSRNCLGVVEIVTTRQKVNYRPELDNVCKALEAVDLRSSQRFIPPNEKVCNESYKAALPDIVEVLTSVSKLHRLPLALTWAPCVQQGKGGCRHSNENYASCVSTVDSACYVADLDILDFYDACSEHHLFRGQGIVGRAFTTNKLCFATDITSFSKTEYPLSHHARMFGLRAAAAIPLRSIYTGSVDFVLEFFLPKECHVIEEQKRLLKSLSAVTQQACQSLHITMDKEIEEEVILPFRDIAVASDGRLSREETQKLVSSPSKEPLPEETSWIHMMEAQKKDKGVFVSSEHNKELKEEFKVTTHWDNTQEGLHHGQVISEFRQLQQNFGPKVSVEGGGNSSSFGDRHSLGGQKTGVKRRTKAEKTISLQVLRQYFAGSLKDAAKNIGVCPTTLKRICRQHGITRWPSRKIKKVGHSLRKLQLVIDSVQGAEGSIQIESFYSSFPELSSPNPSGTGPFSSLQTGDHSKQLNSQPEADLFSLGATSSKSQSSSCNHSSGSSICYSTGAKQQTTIMNASSSGDGSMEEVAGGMLKRAHSDAELHALNQEEPKPLARSLSHKSFCEQPLIETLPPLPKSSGRHFKDGGVFRVKATLGEERIRFSLQPSWGFRELQQEIARRFNIDDISRVDIKYLDDDLEWVLLTCDADLEECIDVYKLSLGHTIKLSLCHRASSPNRGSLVGRGGPS